MWPRRASQRTLADSDTAFIGDHHDVADVQIAPNDTPGLSIRTQSGEWIDAPNSPSTLVVNGGQLLQHRTNDYFLATPHTPSGPRRSKATELGRAAARGVMPTNPDVTSHANSHYQKRFDKLAQLAAAGDWDGVAGYQCNGVNTYAKMVRQYRDRLVAAHKAQGGRYRDGAGSGAVSAATEQSQSPDPRDPRPNSGGH